MKWKLTKFWNIFLIIVSTVAIVGVITVPIILTLQQQKQSGIDGTKNNQTFKYGRNIENFSKSDDVVDQLFKNFYNHNTRPILLTRPTSNGEEIISGTTWYYPWANNDYNRYYFATNIHVVSHCLYLDQFDNIQIDPSFSFWTVKNNGTINPYPGDISLNQRIFLNDVRLEYIALKNNYSQYLPSAAGAWEYSDFAILSTSTNLWGNTPPITDFDFVDTKSEWDLAVNQNKVFYMAGFPTSFKNELNDFYEYVTIKYTTEQTGLTSTSIRQLGYNNYLNQNNGIKIFNNLDTIFHSYSHQLLLPSLDIPPGSSGSLVCVYQDNKIKPLGIWWGIYSSSNGNYITGAMDFFYTDNYWLWNSIVPGYKLI